MFVSGPCCRPTRTETEKQIVLVWCNAMDNYEGGNIVNE